MTEPEDYEPTTADVIGTENVPPGAVGRVERNLDGDLMVTSWEKVTHREAR